MKNRLHTKRVSRCLLAVGTLLVLGLPAENLLSAKLPSPAAAPLTVAMAAPVQQQSFRPSNTQTSWDGLFAAGRW